MRSPNTRRGRPGTGLQGGHPRGPVAAPQTSRVSRPLGLTEVPLQLLLKKSPSQLTHLSGSFSSDSVSWTGLEPMP